MEKSEVEVKLMEILNTILTNSGEDWNAIKHVDFIDDLGIDSLSFISLIIELETIFDIQIPDDWLLIEKFREYSLILSVVEEVIIRKETEDSNCGK